MKFDVIKGTFIVLLLLGCSVAWPSNAPNLAFRAILPDTVETLGFIETIAQDQSGFMWFGGRNGLARYDGYRLHFYKKGDTPGSLQDSRATDMLLASNSVLWIATSRGLHQYLPETDAFAYFEQPKVSTEDVNLNDIRSIVEDKNGDLWLGTRAGLARFNPTEQRFTRYFLEDYPAGSGDNRINVLVIDQHDFIWIGQRSGGLSRFNPEDATFIHYRHHASNPGSLSDNDVREIFIDSKQRLWAGTYSGGLNRLSEDQSHFIHYRNTVSSNNDDIWELVEDHKGRLWLGGGGGLGLYDAAQDSFHRYGPEEHNQQSLSSSSTRTLFVDEAGDLWLGFYPGGINHLDPQMSAFTNFRSAGKDPSRLLGNGVRDTYEDTQGRLWITTGQGLNVLNLDTKQFTGYVRNDGSDNAISGSVLVSVIGDDDGYIWFGVWGKGLNRLNTHTGDLRYYHHGDAKGLSGKQPWDMVIDHQGDLWVGTELGLNRYDKSTDSFTHYNGDKSHLNGQKNLYIRTLYQDKNHRLWIGSSQGLFLFNRQNETFTHFEHDPKASNSLPHNFVRAIFEDSQGTIWLGTGGAGLAKFDAANRQFESFQSRYGLVGDVISSIVEDKQGDLWLGTNEGLVRFSPTQNKSQVFTKKQGLPGNLYERNTFLLTRGGQVVAGSNDGLSIFDPTHVAINDYVPRVWITDLHLMNQKMLPNQQGSPLQKLLPFQEQITLQHSQNIVELGFAALSYRTSRDNLYQFMLEGFDKDWHTVGHRRTATYTNIDPGKYVFKVKGSNNDGVWNPQPATLNITVLPPFHLSWTAYLIYLLLACVVVWGIAAFNVRRQTFIREHEVNNRLRQLDKLKDEFLATTSHELRTPLNGIIGLSENILDSEDKMTMTQEKLEFVKMIHFSGKRLSNLVDDILDFSKLKSHSLQLSKKPIELDVFCQNIVKMMQPLIGNKPIELLYQVPSNIPPLEADEKRLQQIFFNLVGNAIKFTDQGAININVSCVKRAIVIDISDTGIGIPTDQLERIFDSFEQVKDDVNRNLGGTGLGLTITKKLIELHGGSISVTSKPNAGSRFSMQFPLND